MATTLDEVWALFRETDRRFQENSEETGAHSQAED